MSILKLELQTELQISKVHLVWVHLITMAESTLKTTFYLYIPKCKSRNEINDTNKKKQLLLFV